MSVSYKEMPSRYLTPPDYTDRDLETLPDSSERDLELLVTDRHVESDSVISLHLTSATDQQLPQWSPGAHIDVVASDGIIRQYSLCGELSGTNQWRIGIVREPNSRGGSAFIHININVGDKLQVRGPRNNFHLVEIQRYLFIAGGIGITPILPMVRHVADQGLPWTLLYGGRSRKSMAFLEELQDIEGGDLVL